MQRIPRFPHPLISVLLVGCPPRAVKATLAGACRLVVKGSQPARVQSCLHLVLLPDPWHVAESQLLASPLPKRGLRRDLLAQQL